MKVLITGSEGFIGSHFQRRLSNHDLTLIDLVNNNDATDFFRSDSTRFDLVIHCAAIVGGRKTIDGQPAKLLSNFGLDSEMLMHGLRNKTRKTVYFSSSAAYPMRLQTQYITLPLIKESKLNQYKLKETDINLDDIKNSDPSIYGVSKLTGEQIIRYIRNDLPVWIFRPFSGYSERQSLDYPFPSFIERAKCRTDPFDIWGDGNQVRDWVHVDDIVNFTLEAIDIAEPDVFNICTGRPTSFNEFAHILTDMVGYSPQFNRILDAPVGVQYRVGDPTKQNMIYVPKITLEEGIQRALNL